MSQQVYGRSRQSYAPSYYPSSNTNNPQRVIAQVETVTREVVRNPGTVVEPVKEIRSHGDGQLTREDEFVNKLRDETIKASADLNDASRSIQPGYIEPKVLSSNPDQVQLGDHVVCEEGVPRSIQPRDHYGNGTMSDGWREPSDLAYPSHPRKVAELVNRVSNWQGANGYDRSKPISVGYGYNKGYDQIVGYGGDNTYNNSRYGGYGSSCGKLGESYTGSRNNNEWNKLPNSPQGYEQVGYGGDSTNRISPSSKIGEMGYGNRGRLADDDYTRWNVVNPQAPLAGSGYSYTIGSTSKPLSKQEGYQYGYNEPRVDYNGGSEGAISGPVITCVEAASKYNGTFVL